MAKLLVQLIVVGLLCYVLYWVMGLLGLPEPIKVAVLVLVAMVGVYRTGLLAEF